MCAGRQTALARDILQNPTVFGQILRKERSARILFEDSEFLAFRNLKPYARLAGLVIPKEWVPQDPLALTWKHLPLVRRLRAIGRHIVECEQPGVARRRDYWLKFHIPPHISVDHLHLHVIAPVSRIAKWDVIARFTDPRKACDVESVVQRLAQAEQAELNRDMCESR